MQLPASATLSDSQALLSLLGKALANGSQASGPVQVDASALKHFDTSTIALLMQARRLAQQAGRTFSVQGVPDKLVELAQLYGVEELLALPPTSKAAQTQGSAGSSTASGPGGGAT